MGEETINEECIYGDDDGRHKGIEDEQRWYRDPLVHGIWILKGIVAEGEVLVVWLDGIEGKEGEEENPGWL